MRFLTVALLVGVSLTMAACASNRTNLRETGAVAVKIDDGPGSPVQYVTVYLDQEEGETIIRGKVRGTGTPFYPRYGKHVHVTVISPDGQVIIDETPRLLWQTRSKFRSATGRFTVRLPEPVPNGAVVDVVFHDRLYGTVPNG